MQTKAAAGTAPLLKEPRGNPSPAVNPQGRGKGPRSQSPSPLFSPPALNRMVKREHADLLKQLLCRKEARGTGLLSSAEIGHLPRAAGQGNLCQLRSVPAAGHPAGSLPNRVRDSASLPACLPQKPTVTFVTDYVGLNS